MSVRAYGETALGTDLPTGEGLDLDDDRRLSALYRSERAGLLAFAFVLTGSLVAAEDLVQDAFVAAQAKWSSIRDYDDPGAWLRRVVANRSVSRTRRWLTQRIGLERLRTRSHTETQPGVPAADLDLWRAVARLPRRQAQLVALVYVEDRTVAEAARILEIGEPTAKTHLQRARASLAVALADEKDET